MAVEPAPAGALWAEFGRQLRCRRRQAGITQLQLGMRVGYHHTFISKLEKGMREPSAGLVRLLDSVLNTGGELAAIVATPRTVPQAASRSSGGPMLFALLPGGDGTGDVRPMDPGLWPATLPAEGLPCPLHGTVGCAVPGHGEVMALLPGLTSSHDGFMSASGVESELLHGLTAVLACLIREAVLNNAPDGGATVERLLRAVVRWAEAVSSTGRLPYGQLRLAAQYAQIAGRLRMQCGQSSIGMVWFGHGLGWAGAVQDASARATLLSDMCTLVRLDQDAGSALAYAEAIGTAGTRWRWTVTLSHLYQARGYALGHDAAQCRRHISQARRVFARLGDQDFREAPWLSGPEGEARLESAIGGALRDLAAVTGDRATAWRAVEATTRARTQLPALMRDSHLLLTLRLADSWACMGDPGAAVELAAPVLRDAVRSRELMINAELRGLYGRLAANWGGLTEVRHFRERWVDAGA